MTFKQSTRQPQCREQTIVKPNELEPGYLATEKYVQCVFPKDHSGNHFSRIPTIEGGIFIRWST